MYTHHTSLFYLTFSIGKISFVYTHKFDLFADGNDDKSTAIQDDGLNSYNFRLADKSMNNGLESVR